MPCLRALEWLSRSLSQPMHPGWLRCSSVTYQQYAPSSRLACRAPRPRSSTDLTIRGPLGRADRRRVSAADAGREKAHHVSVGAWHVEGHEMPVVLGRWTVFSHT